MRERAGMEGGEARKAFVTAAVQAGGALGPEPACRDRRRRGGWRLRK
jgi:hypothetical protein